MNDMWICQGSKGDFKFKIAAQPQKQTVVLLRFRDNFWITGTDGLTRDKHHL